MTSISLNPALSYLLRARASAALRRWHARFCSPRRFALSLLALLLTVIWLGNAVASILFRQPYRLDTLRIWVPAILMCYWLWHVLKVAWRRPEEAIEWHPAERDIVCGGPFSRRELLTYRLTAVMTATFAKALCTSLLLMPDIPIWPVGFLGMSLALGFLELWRMVLEISAHGCSRRAYLWFRAAAFGLAALLVGSVICTVSGIAFPNGSTAASSHLLQRVSLAVMRLRETSMGQLCEAPFQPFVQVITAETIFSAAFLGWVCASGLLVAVMFRLVFRVDAVARASQILAERAVYRSSGMGNRFAQGASQFLPASLPRILHLGGIGPFAWRQMVGALRYKFSLPVALIAPALLSLYPLLQPLEPMSAFLQVVGGLVFYSFLLLPAALKFDFRRDFDHLAAFKMLPASPVTIVCGQLATPVLLTTLLQMLVLAVVALIKPVPVAHLLAVSGVLLPINVLIFAMENLIFMLSPHRLNQEGIDIFLRTILVFTAKGVFFAAALFMLLAWSHLARSLSHVVSAHWGIDASNRLLFMAGIWLMTVVTACLCTKLLVRAFRHYDPSLDAAGS